MKDMRGIALLNVLFKWYMASLIANMKRNCDKSMVCRATKNDPSEGAVAIERNDWADATNPTMQSGTRDWADETVDATRTLLVGGEKGCAASIIYATF